MENKLTLLIKIAPLMINIAPINKKKYSNIIFKMAEYTK
jgi:hypothetical protein